MSENQHMSERGVEYDFEEMSPSPTTFGQRAVCHTCKVAETFAYKDGVPTCPRCLAAEHEHEPEVIPA